MTEFKKKIRPEKKGIIIGLIAGGILSCISSGLIDSPVGKGHLSCIAGGNINLIDFAVATLFLLSILLPEERKPRFKLSEFTDSLFGALLAISVVSSSFVLPLVLLSIGKSMPVC